MMSARRAPTGLILIAFIAACKGGSDDSDDTGHTDTGYPASPCANGSWGGFDDPAQAVHVRAEVSSVVEPDGSASAPFTSVAEAVDALSQRWASGEENAREGIFLGVGEFEVHIDLGEGINDIASLQLGGCGPEETTTIPEPQDDESLAFQVRARGISSLALEGLRLEGGYRSVWLWDGTQASIEDVEIVGATTSGILIDGVTTFASLSDVQVSSTTAALQADLTRIGGYGICVNNAEVTMQSVTVDDSYGVGILVDGRRRGDMDTMVTMQDVSVSNTTQTSSGVLGRGVHMQSVTRAEVNGLTLENNSDAGLYAMASLELEFEDVVVSTVGSSTIPDSSELSGDGIVITGLDDDNTDPAASLYSVSLRNSNVQGVSRTGVLLERVTVELEGNSVSGTTEDLAAQLDAILSGGDAGSVVELEEVVSLNYSTEELTNVTE